MPDTGPVDTRLSLVKIHTGREVERHLGFLDKKSIVAAFEKLGVPEGGGYRSKAYFHPVWHPIEILRDAYHKE
jgi:hypothetical protein